MTLSTIGRGFAAAQVAALIAAAGAGLVPLAANAAQIEPQQCVTANGSDTGGYVSIGAPDGSEKSVQTILSDAGYSLNADTDQQNYQEWDDSGNTVHFSVTYLKKQAGDTHTFGYFVNGGTFQPLFRDGTDATYNSAPLKAAGDTVAFDVPNVNDVVFAIVDWNGSTHTTYATKKSLNSGEQHAVVYKPTSNEFVLAFEDLPLSAPNKDYNDLVVKVNVSSCDNPNTATIVATKIVCDSESDLPNWGLGNGPDIGASTASTFLAAHPNSCHLEPDWKFETAPANSANPGDNLEAAGAPWTPSSFTDGNGAVSITVPTNNGSYVWVREQLQDGYIPFTYNLNPDHPNSNADNESAELYCGVDHLNYDNWDRVDNLQAGHTYYCVAFNAPKENQCNPKASQVVVSDTGTTDTTDNSPAVLLSFIHSSWVPNLSESGAKWIWSDNPVVNPTVDTTKVFTKTFTIIGTPTGGSVDIAADNGFILTVNGQPVVDKFTEEHNYEASQNYDISDELQTGLNTIEVTVKNFGLADNSAAQNPAGLIFQAHISNNECDEPPPPHECPSNEHFDNESCVPNEQPTGADVTITKAVGRVTAPADSDISGETTAPGDELVYTITVNNDGPDAANNVVVTDELPSEVTYVSDSEADAVESSGTVTWTIGTLPVGKVTLNIFVNVKENVENGTSIENTATVSSDNDSNDGDNDGSVSVTATKESITDTSTTKKKKTLGGQGGGGGGGSVAGAFTQVLGESCGLYMEKYLKPGSPKNDPDQVTKLQVFLNTWMNAGLPVTGFYGPLTIKALNAFQAKYADQILTPWGIGGPTSLVYLSTLREINLLQCPALSLQLPELVPWSENPNAQ